MRIAVIGGGPAGLYFALLMQRARPEANIEVFERNRPGDTFGFGVVFSDETLSHFERADEPTFREIQNQFISWRDIETHYRGQTIVSTGHGFCGLSRKALLAILERRAVDLGVRIRSQTEVDANDLPQADLIVAADGLHSIVRKRHESAFRPSIDWRKCKFSWLGTSKPLSAFKFVFAETEFGPFVAHAYPYEPGLSTWIVECREETWRRAGLDRASEADTVTFCEGVFRECLDGHPLIANRSIWRTFPTVRNERWHHENVVLVGDAAHTAHFSIGSGTKLAMEDAIALADALRCKSDLPLAEILGHYEQSRRGDVAKIQRSAQTSLEWFENVDRYLGQHPTRFQFNLVSRSKRITYENLLERDPKLVADVTEVCRAEALAPRTSDGAAPPPMFLPLRLRDIVLANRCVVSPMCQYSAEEGTVTDWHLVHLGSRALGGAGLVLTEMTNVSPEGRITPGCAGLWNREHVAAWERVVRFVKSHSASVIGIQLAHAGRKGSVSHPWNGRDVPLTNGAWTTLGPSALPFEPSWPAPKAMDSEDFDRIRAQFVASTRLALECGFDLVELHMAHGYLLSSFLSPLSNTRCDAYGGSLENRMRFPLEVTRAVRDVWPASHPLAVRISATDWLGAEGFTDDESVLLARALKAVGVDILDVSTAGNSPRSRPDYGRMYQVPFAERIRYEAQMPVMAVGAIQGADHVNTLIAAGRADLCCLARPHLYDPYLTLHAAEELGYPDVAWPGQYLAGRNLPRGG